MRIPASDSSSRDSGSSSDDSASTTDPHPGVEDAVDQDTGGTDNGGGSESEPSGHPGEQLARDRTPTSPSAGSTGGGSSTGKRPHPGVQDAVDLEPSRTPPEPHAGELTAYQRQFGAPDEQHLGGIGPSDGERIGTDELSDREQQWVNEQRQDLARRTGTDPADFTAVERDGGMTVVPDRDYYREQRNEFAAEHGYAPDQVMIDETDEGISFRVTEDTRRFEARKRAADNWGVPVSDVELESGEVRHSPDEQDQQRTEEEGGDVNSGDISPGAAMSLSDPDAIAARAEKEDEILGWRDVDSVSDLPGAAAGHLFGAGQAVEDAGVGAGEWISGAVPGAEVGPQIGEEHVGEVPSNLVGGSVSFLGMGVGAVAQFPGSAAADVGDMLEGEETPTEVQGGNLALGQSFGETQVEMVADYPLSTAAGFAVPSVSGVPAAVRGARATRGTSGRVRWDEITTEQGARGDNPNFDTPTNAPTRDAIGELEGRMANQPDLIQEQAGGGVLFHTTRSDFGSRLDVGEGASEYPGLFASPEASPLGMDRVTRPSDEGFSFGLGDYSLQEGRAPAFRPRDLEGIPESAAEPGYSVRGADGEVIETGLSRFEANQMIDPDLPGPTPYPSGNRAPDPTTAGYEFFTEQAPTETGMVRPPGDRTPEMEAIFAPDSQFQQTGAVGVEMPDGRTIRSDIYEPAGEPARGGDAPRADGDAAVDGQTRTASDISESAYEPTQQPDVTAESMFGTTSIAGDPAPTTAGAETTPTRTDAGTTSPTATETVSTDYGTGSSPFDATAGSKPAPTPTDSGSGTSRGSGTSTGSGSRTGTGSPTTPGPGTSTGPFGGPTEPGPSTSPTERAPPMTPSEPTPSYSPGESYGTPFGVPTDPVEPVEPTRPRRRKDDESGEFFGFDGEPVEPETPEYFNPIASGTGDLFGGGFGDSMFDDGGSGGRQSGETDGLGGEPLGPFG